MVDDKYIEQVLKLNCQLTATQKAEMKEQLVLYINHLLLHDFNKLIQILYRVDVSEQKLKEFLQVYPQADAATVIVEFLIQRQQEKIQTREAFRPNTDIPEEDKW